MIDKGEIWRVSRGNRCPPTDHVSTFNGSKMVKRREEGVPLCLAVWRFFKKREITIVKTLPNKEAKKDWAEGDSLPIEYVKVGRDKVNRVLVYGKLWYILRVASGDCAPRYMGLCPQEDQHASQEAWSNASLLVYYWQEAK